MDTDLYAWSLATRTDQQGMATPAAYWPTDRRRHLVDYGYDRARKPSRPYFAACSNCRLSVWDALPGPVEEWGRAHGPVGRWSAPGPVWSEREQAA
jgi:hypothetical protein